VGPERYGHESGLDSARTVDPFRLLANPVRFASVRCLQPICLLPSTLARNVADRFPRDRTAETVATERTES